MAGNHDDISDETYQAAWGPRPSAARVASAHITASVQPVVAGFLLILQGLLLQEDALLSKQEMRHGGRANIYRMGHFLEALQRVRTDVRGTEDSSEPADLQALKASVSRRFEPDFRPVKKLIKQLDAYLANGTPPRYNVPPKGSPANHSNL